jgi:hypothetical protein
MQLRMRTAVVRIAGAMVLAVSLSACASASRSGRGQKGYLQPMPGAGDSSLSSQTPATLRRSRLPQPGVTQNVDSGGARLAVTLRSVVDPLRDSGTELPAGTRAVAVVFQIRSAGPKLYDSSATGDISILVSNGLVTPVLATRGACKTPVEDFDRYITAGEDRIGCVVFAVANDATLDAVRFSPHAQRLGRLTWAP